MKNHCYKQLKSNHEMVPLTKHNMLFLIQDQRKKLLVLQILGALVHSYYGSKSLKANLCK